MNISEIKKIMDINSTESVIYEKMFNSNSIGNDICSLLNSGGGFVVTSITDQDKYKYLSIESELQRLERTVVKDIVPKSLFSFELKENGNSTFLVIEVPAGKEIPYSYRNTIFIKKGNQSIKADIDTVKDMIISKQNEPIRWERRFSDADFDIDFDQDHYGSVLGNMTQTNRFIFTEEKNQEIFSYLGDLSVYKYGKLTNAGDVVFCKNPAMRYPQIRAKAVMFLNDRTDNKYHDLKYFEGPLLVIYKELSNFIARNTPTSAYFLENDPRRQNKQLYPERAIREGLINALAHRDYSNFSGSISVSIYPDRLEIWNYGEFPEGVTVRSLDKGNVSVLRNPDIAHILYLQDFMEKLGRGAKFIKKECIDNGLPEPKWNSEKGKGVTLTFFAPAESSLKLAESGSKPADTDRLRPIMTDLTKQEQTIVEYLRTHKRFILIDIEKLLDIKHSRAREILLRLSKKNIIQKFEKGSKTYYVSII